MMIRSLCAAAIGALLSGCATVQLEDNLSTAHPANPQAVEGPIPPRSQTLALNDVPRQASADEDAMMTMQHGGMSHMAGMQGMDHDMHGAHHDSPATRPGENAAISSSRWTPTTVPTTAAALYNCPMHKEVVSTQPGKCPKCGMKLLPKQPASQPVHSGHGGRQ